uniref:MUTSd domain-containing protein n=1 Tax=Mesocestoides corti TaxID=53468 RepID=A0A5K3EGB8_MESCO
MSGLDAQSGVRCSYLPDELSEYETEREEIFMTICIQGDVCGIAFSSFNGVLKYVPDFQTTQSTKEISSVILDVNPSLIIATETVLAKLEEVISNHNSKTFVIPNSSTNLDACLQRVGLIKLPYAPAFVDEGENATFIMSLLPNDVPLTIRAIGALLDYLAKQLSPVENFPNRHCVNILDIQLHMRKSYTYIDSATLVRLQIFDSSIQDPVSNGGNAKAAQCTSDVTLFGYLNSCSSSLGSRRLAKWLRLPLRDHEELQRRLQAVEFLSTSANRSLHGSLVRSIKRVSNIQRVLSKMHTSGASPNEWKMLLQTMHSVNEIVDACRPHPELNASFGSMEGVDSPRQVLVTLLEKIVDTIDISSTSSHKRFIVKQGYQSWLDEWKQIYRCLPDILSRLAEHELNRLRGYVDACGLIYFPLVGYLLQIPSSQASEELHQLGLQYIFTNGDLTYYRTETTQELDRRYGDVMYAILDAETSIMHELQEEILKSAKPLLQLLDYVTELDCLCALATAASKMNGVRPRIVPGNSIRIKRGRHILYEALHPNYRTNSFASPGENGSVTLITGPNASGKTMYIKQIGLIVFLAHIGSFVPAHSASISQLDTILALIPADLGRNELEPLSDASWLAMALRHTTPKSLLLLDEFPYFADKVRHHASLKPTSTNLVMLFYRPRESRFSWGFWIT